MKKIGYKVLAVGDGDNDVSMLLNATVGIAIKNEMTN